MKITLDIDPFGPYAEFFWGFYMGAEPHQNVFPDNSTYAEFRAQAVAAMGESYALEMEERIKDQMNFLKYSGEGAEMERNFLRANSKYKGHQQ